uniref:RING finger protein 17 n=1 Tax=Calidris pygmaea TaxID=425635 RepID=A0A8C3J7A4_9CHAR
MATIYEKSQPQSVKWESGMQCAVYVCDLKQWQRGQISRIVSETSAEVVVFPLTVQAVSKTSKLGQGKGLWLILGDANFPCTKGDYNLFCVRPTGGSMQWTATVCEFLSDYLTGTQVKIITQVCNQNESDVASALPVKIFYKDETEQLIDISQHLIEKGLAFRNRRTDKADVDCGDSKEHLKVHLEQENTRVDGCNSETPCAKKDAAAEENSTVSESEQKSCKTYKTLLHSGMDEIYKSPAIPKAKIFQAVVSCVGRDGTIYIIPKSLEIELNKLMTEIQSNFKCLGLLESYCWKKGEACVVRGSDTMWYRGKVVEFGGGTLQVQYIDRGCIEMVPQCHLYPTTSYIDIPPFCIPCELYKTIPVSNGKFEDILVGIQINTLFHHTKDETSLWYLFFLPTRKIVDKDHLSKANLMKQSATEGDANWDSETVSLDEALKWCNKSVESLPLVTHFQREMPCLVEYQDGLWYRGKLLSIEEFDPVKILVQFVDYGSFSANTFHFCSRLRHIPYHLLKYPVEAIRALLTGFKPVSYDKNVERIPYSPEWSVEALWAMMECVEGKQLSASMLAVSPEVTISLYEDDENPVHMKLIEMGLADLDE